MLFSLFRFTLFQLDFDTSFTPTLADTREPDPFPASIPDQFSTNQPSSSSGSFDWNAFPIVPASSVNVSQPAVYSNNQVTSAWDAFPAPLSSSSGSTKAAAATPSAPTLPADLPFDQHYYFNTPLIHEKAPISPSAGTANNSRHSFTVPMNQILMPQQHPAPYHQPSVYHHQHYQQHVQMHQQQVVSHHQQQYQQQHLQRQGMGPSSYQQPVYQPSVQNGYSWSKYPSQQSTAQWNGLHPQTLQFQQPLAQASMPPIQQHTFGGGYPSQQQHYQQQYQQQPPHQWGSYANGSAQQHSTSLSFPSSSPQRQSQHTTSAGRSSVDLLDWGAFDSRQPSAAASIPTLNHTFSSSNTTTAAAVADLKSSDPFARGCDEHKQQQQMHALATVTSDAFADFAVFGGDTAKSRSQQMPSTVPSTSGGQFSPVITKCKGSEISSNGYQSISAEQTPTSCNPFDELLESFSPPQRGGDHKHYANEQQNGLLSAPSHTPIMTVSSSATAMPLTAPVRLLPPPPPPPPPKPAKDALKIAVTVEHQHKNPFDFDDSIYSDGKSNKYDAGASSLSSLSAGRQQMQEPSYLVSSQQAPQRGNSHCTPLQQATPVNFTANSIKVSNATAVVADYGGNGMLKKSLNPFDDEWEDDWSTNKSDTAHDNNNNWATFADFDANQCVSGVAVQVAVPTLMVPPGVCGGVSGKSPPKPVKPAKPTNMSMIRNSLRSLSSRGSFSLNNNNVPSSSGGNASIGDGCMTMGSGGAGLAGSPRALCYDGSGSIIRARSNSVGEGKFECPSCLNVYLFAALAPLPCFHQLCLNCWADWIEMLALEGKETICPTCRIVVTE